MRLSEITDAKFNAMNWCAIFAYWTLTRRRRVWQSERLVRFVEVY